MYNSFANEIPGGDNVDDDNLPTEYLESIIAKIQ